MAKECGPMESSETMASEAKSHPKKFLAGAMKAKGQLKSKPKSSKKMKIKR
jgi:hypothetical protein